MQTTTAPQPQNQLPLMPPSSKAIRKIPVKQEFASPSAVQRSLRVAAYCRVSTKKDEQHLSYEAQQTAYTDRIMANPEWQLAGIYADKGITGTNATKRPAFMKLMRDCQAGKVDLIITKSVQRFARNTLDLLSHVRALRKLGIGVYFEIQGLDTRKMTDEMMLTLLAGVAQSESENLSANVRWGKQRAFGRGSVPFAYSSFLGYRKGDNGQPEIVPEEAAIIQRIYSEFLAGASVPDITKHLTADGIPTPKGKAIWGLWRRTKHPAKRALLRRCTPRKNLHRRLPNT